MKKLSKRFTTLVVLCALTVACLFAGLMLNLSTSSQSKSVEAASTSDPAYTVEIYGCWGWYKTGIWYGGVPGNSYNYKVSVYNTDGSTVDGSFSYTSLSASPKQTNPDYYSLLSTTNYISCPSKITFSCDNNKFTGKIIYYGVKVYYKGTLLDSYYTSHKYSTVGSGGMSSTKTCDGASNVYTFTVNNKTVDGVSETDALTGFNVSKSNAVYPTIKGVEFYRNNKKGTIATPQSTDYNFLGYFIGETKIYDADLTLVYSGAVTSGATLEAKWGAEKFTVSIAVNNAEYGSVSPTVIYKVPRGTAINVNGATAEINGTVVTATPSERTSEYNYIFGSWSMESTTVTGDMTITANFIRRENPAAYSVEIYGCWGWYKWGGIWYGGEPSSYEYKVSVYNTDGSTVDGSFSFTKLSESPKHTNPDYYSLISTTDYVSCPNKITFACKNNSFTAKIIYFGVKLYYKGVLLDSYYTNHQFSTVGADDMARTKTCDSASDLFTFTVNNDTVEGVDKTSALTGFNVPKSLTLYPTVKNVKFYSKNTQTTFAAPTCEHATFLGYYLGDTKIFDDDLILVYNGNLTAGGTLNAKWELDKYTVSISVNNAEYGSVNVSSVANVPYGTVITTSGNTMNVNGTIVTATPTTSTAQYAYSFKSFNMESTKVTGAMTVTAEFSRDTVSYTVKFINYDDSELKTYTYKYGETPKYDGETPVRPSTTKISYKFTDWDKPMNVVTGNQTYKAQYKEIFNASASLSLGGDIVVNFYLYVPYYTTDTEAYVELTYNHNKKSYSTERTTDTILIKELTPNENGVYKFSCGLAAAQICDKIDIELFDGEGNKLYSKNDYSIRNYCEQVINQNTGSELVAICKALMNYGGYAQVQFGYNLDDIANKGKDYAHDIDVVTPESITPKRAITENAEGLTLNGDITFMALDKSAIRFYFDLEEGYTVLDYELSVTDDSLVRFGKNNAGNYIEVYDITSIQLDDAFTVKVKNVNSETETVITYSVLDNVREKLLSSPTESAANLAKAIKLYSDAANAYFGK